MRHCRCTFDGQVILKLKPVPNDVLDDDFSALVVLVLGIVPPHCITNIGKLRLHFFNEPVHEVDLVITGIASDLSRPFGPSLLIRLQEQAASSDLLYERIDRRMSSVQCTQLYDIRRCQGSVQSAHGLSTADENGVALFQDAP